MNLPQTKPLKRRRLKRVAIFLAAILSLIIIFFIIFVNRILEPVLKERLHTLIIEGSDSLYTYKLGKLNANFFGGNVEVENLQINIDSNRYNQLAAKHALPSLTFQLNLVKGHIKGIGIYALFFNKVINIKEIMSKDANIRLLRHIKKDDAPENALPLWKAMQPTINGINIERIKLDGVKLLYKNADTSESIKIQFDRCDALFDDIKIDSVSSADTSRIGFTKAITMNFNDLKFRTDDSTYKLKAEVIKYSSAAKTFEVQDFKLQPTLERNDFYKAVGHQFSVYTILFDKIKFTNFQLDKYLHNNIIVADSVFIDKPDIDIYYDRTFPIAFESKIGQYPHQKILKAKSTMMIKGIVVNGAQLTYTEKNDKTLQEGKLVLKDVNIKAINVTNDSNLIKQNPLCVAQVSGKILHKSPLSATFTFYLDSTNGAFAANGNITNVAASQLNELAVPLANIKMESFNISSLNFAMRGDDFGANGNVQMLYNNLLVTVQKRDEETGITSTKKFLTKVLNKYALLPNNPGTDGRIRTAGDVKVARISTQSFFAVIWKTISAGMEAIMMNTGS